MREQVAAWFVALWMLVGPGRVEAPKPSEWRPIDKGVPEWTCLEHIATKGLTCYRPIPILRVSSRYLQEP